MSNPTTTLPSRRVSKGEVVRVVWKDAIEGPIQQDFANQRGTQMRNTTTAIISTTGRYLKVANGYLILDEVLREESNGQVLYEKQAGGKWLAIPLGVINQVSQVGQILETLANETKRRRTILSQLRYLPRTKRLPTGELGRTLYLT